MSTVMGKDSFLKIDQWGRMLSIRKLFRVKRFKNSRYRHTVVSDSSLQWRLKDFPTDTLRSINHSGVRMGIELGLVYKTAVVDGSGLWGKAYSSLGFTTKWSSIFLVDFEPIKKRGKELESSERLIRRAHEMFPGLVIEYLLTDALYFNNRFFALVEDGIVGHLVIRYTPDDMESAGRFRKIFEYFQELVFIYQKEKKTPNERSLLSQMGFSQRRGKDNARGVSYTIYFARNNSYDNRFKIALIEEQEEGKLPSRFFVITTDKEMEPEQMRIGGHRRWCIENNGFKDLNRHIQSKRYWTHDQKVRLNLLLIQILAFSLINLFYKMKKYYFHKIYKTKKITLCFVVEILFSDPYLRSDWLDR